MSVSCQINIANRGVFLTSSNSGDSLLTVKRFRHSIRPGKPKMPTWKRKKMVEFAAPKFSEEHPTTKNLWQDCPRHFENLENKVKEQPNAWEAIYIRELVELAESSQMIGFYHFNDIPGRSFRKVSIQILHLCTIL